MNVVDRTISIGLSRQEPRLKLLVWSVSVHWTSSYVVHFHTKQSARKIGRFLFIYWSNVLTERFSIPYKINQGRYQFRDLNFDLRLDTLYFYSKKYEMGGKNHLTVTGFFKSSKTWF